MSDTNEPHDDGNERNGETHQERMSRIIDDGGGCAETWGVLSELRQTDRGTPSDGSSRLQRLTGALLDTLGFDGFGPGGRRNEPVEVEISSSEIKNQLEAKRDYVEHVASFGLLDVFEPDPIMAEIENGETGQMVGRKLRNDRGETHRYAILTHESLLGEITVGFNLTTDRAFFDFPDYINPAPIVRDWNDRMTAADCSDRDRGGYCDTNKRTCDNCNNRWCQYCDSTMVAAPDCWYLRYDCCSTLGWCNGCRYPAWGNC